MNGIRRMKPFNYGKQSKFTPRDLTSSLLVIAGAKVSNMPSNYSSEAYSTNWEMFNPEKVTNPNILPDYWKMVFDLHNEKDMGECRYLKYRYVHIPIDILPRYPRVLCKGIFCLTNKDIKFEDIKADDLIHIGNEFTN